jgi:hypothetical protein
MEEINGFFMNGIPARKWRDQPRLDEMNERSFREKEMMRNSAGDEKISSVETEKSKLFV